MSKQWSDVSRRGFLVGATTLGLTAPLLVYSKPQKRQKAQVVIVGGGYGGITAAKYIKKENPNLEVILIEQRPFFMSCPMEDVPKIVSLSKILDRKWSCAYNQ